MKTWLCAAAMAVAAIAGSAAQAEPTAMPAEAEHGFTPALATAYITDVQQNLTARGYYAGLVDGRMNPALRTAISVYQSDVGMRVTGVPDLAVVNMLRFGPDVKATIQPLGSQLGGSQLGGSQLGGSQPPVPVAPPPAIAASPEPRRQIVPARTAGVPPYEAPEPYRYPTPTTALEADEPKTAEESGCPPLQQNAKPRRLEAKGALKAEEPPLPKAAPQPKVTSSPLPAG